MENFDKNIFINCPFDEDYYPLLRPMLFTILYNGYSPRIALENSDSGKSRIEKLRELIWVSKYSIHDLSRLVSKVEEEFYRLNMPFELGLDFGCRCYSDNKQNSKKFLVLEKEKFRYMKAISDLNGFDIKNHEESPEEIIKVLRNWFVETVKIQNVKSGTNIWYEFIDFWSELQVEKEKERFTQNEIDFMPIPELITCMKNWMEKRL